MKRNENGHYRGLHIAVINPKSGKIVSTHIFDTYKCSDKFDDFINNDVPNHCIIAAACKDACNENMSEEVF